MLKATNTNLRGNCREDRKKKTEVEIDGKINFSRLIFFWLLLPTSFRVSLFQKERRKKKIVVIYSANLINKSKVFYLFILSTGRFLLGQFYPLNFFFSLFFFVFPHLLFLLSLPQWEGNVFFVSAAGNSITVSNTTLSLENAISCTRIPSHFFLWYFTPFAGKLRPCLWVPEFGEKQNSFETWALSVLMFSGGKKFVILLENGLSVISVHLIRIRVVYVFKNFNEPTKS